MRANKKPATKTSETPVSEDFVSRSKAAAKVMTKQLRAEHKRWKMPLLSWKEGKITTSNP